MFQAGFEQVCLISDGINLAWRLSVMIVYGWGLLMWEIGRRLGHYGDHPRPQVVDRGTPSRVDKRVAPDREGATDKQCPIGEGKLWSQYVITNREEGNGKPPRLFPKTGYPLGYIQNLLYSRRLKRQRDRERQYMRSMSTDFHDYVGDDGISDEAVSVWVNGTDEQQLKQDQRQLIAVQPQRVKPVTRIYSHHTHTHTPPGE